MDLTGAAEVIGATAGLAHQVKPAIAEAVKLLDALDGKPITVAGAMLADEGYAWRIERQIAWAVRIKARLDAAGMKPWKALPRGWLLNMINAAGDTEGEEVLDLLADVFAAAVSDDVYQHPVYRMAVSQMNADEVHIVRTLASNDRPELWRFRIAPGVNVAFVHRPPARLHAPDRTSFYVENLARLGVVWPPSYQKNEITQDGSYGGPVAPPEQLVQLAAEDAAKINSKWTTAPAEVLRIYPTEVGTRLAQFAVTLT